MSKQEFITAAMRQLKTRARDVADHCTAAFVREYLERLGEGEAPKTISPRHSPPFLHGGMFHGAMSTALKEVESGLRAIPRESVVPDVRRETIEDLSLEVAWYFNPEGVHYGMGQVTESPASVSVQVFNLLPFAEGVERGQTRSPIAPKGKKVVSEYGVLFGRRSDKGRGVLLVASRGVWFTPTYTPDVSDGVGAWVGAQEHAASSVA